MTNRYLALTCLVMSVLLLGGCSGCGGERVGADLIKKLEGGTVVGMDSKWIGSDAVIIKSKAGCDWRIYTTSDKNNLYAKPVDKSCNK